MKETTKKALDVTKYQGVEKTIAEKFQKIAIELDEILNDTPERRNAMNDLVQCRDFFIEASKIEE